MTDEIVLDPLQQQAVDLCCDVDNRVVAVSGPAGTGKTTILRQVYNILTDHGYRVVLCSPTGKAAKRIYEATGIEAMTIHRLLEYSHPGDPDPKTGKPLGYSAPKRHRMNRLEFDVVLADEYAMVNTDVHRNLFDALPSGGVVRCFGDDNQLAPIEEDKRNQDGPSPFQSLLANKAHASVKLEVVFRQGSDSGILLNATNLLKSRTPIRNDQWDQRITDQPVREMLELVRKLEQEGTADFSGVHDQIIVPQNTSWVGTLKLNRTLRGIYHNESDPCVFLPRKPWVIGDDDKKENDDKKQHSIRVYVGDKVIYTANNYDLGIYNGETGRVIEINEDFGEIVVDFGDREQAIPPVQLVTNRYGNEVSIDPRKDLDLAYAITTHKTQGSEYKRIIYILNKSNLYMITRRNFYTAVSRAREHVYIFADQKGLSAGVYKRD